MRKKILIADQDKTIGEFFQILFRKLSSGSSFVFEVSLTESAPKTFSLLKNNFYDLVVIDLHLPFAEKDLSPLDLIKNIKTFHPKTVVLAMTSFEDSSLVKELLKTGVLECAVKPFHADKIKNIICSIFKITSGGFPNPLSKGAAPPPQAAAPLKARGVPLTKVIGESLVMKKLYTGIQQLCDYEQRTLNKKSQEGLGRRRGGANVLITGESGTGKELTARLIHQLGPLKDRPFVAVNCGAVPDTLIESEIFGHKKGSFTGAVEDKPGFFELADTGTLFLDEIGELSMAVQPKLLRALQEKLIRPVGSAKEKKVHVRLITATNRDLEDMVKAGHFREDLFYRLNVVRFHVPPLRERKEDIPLLVKHFLKQRGKKGPELALSPAALKAFEQYDYPGNVRELENLIERILVLGDKAPCAPNEVLHFLKTGGLNLGAKLPEHAGAALPLPEEGIALEQTISALEKNFIQQALKKTHGHRGEAARLLQLTLRAFRRRLSKHNLDS